MGRGHFFKWSRGRDLVRSRIDFFLLGGGGRCGEVGQNWIGLVPTCLSVDVAVNSMS